jgi:membrane protein implicated in regulation of membrane protease activity
LIDTPTVVVLLLLGTVIMVAAGVQSNPTLQLLGGFVAVLVIVLALLVLFFVFIKRLNADIDSDRHDLRRELDDIVEDDDE